MTFSLLLTAGFIFILLDTFIIPKVLQPFQGNETLKPYASFEQAPQSNDIESALTQPDDIRDTEGVVPVITETSYRDENIDISIETIRVYDADVYIADIRISSIDYLRAAFAQNVYGRNINEKTSVIAGEQNAIFAINGDYYGFRNDGWVLRNGVLYRSGGSEAALLVDMDGNFSCDSDDTSIENSIQDKWQIWSFGPPLVIDDTVSVQNSQGASGRPLHRNPRTAIGQVGELHYIFIVSDGRTQESAGLTLYQLASLFKERGCSIAYNLDGGGSSAMYFNGQIINRPSTDGKRIVEREISDIVYIGY